MVFLHGNAKQMVRGGFVHIPLALAVDGDHAGFAAVHHEVRKSSGAAVLPLTDGHRCPKRVAQSAFTQMATGIERQLLRTASVTWPCRTPFFLRTGQEFVATCGVAVETTAGHDDAAFDIQSAFNGLTVAQCLTQHHTMHTVFIFQQSSHFGLCDQMPFARDVAVEHARDHGVAHDPTGAAWVQQFV